MNTLTIRLILGLGVALAAFFGARQVLQWKADAEAYKARSAQQTQTAEATSAITAGASAAQQDGEEAEASVDNARAGYLQRYEVLRNEDEIVADWGAGDIPISVRELARARRCARDGSRGVASGCPRNDTASGTGRPGEQPGRRSNE